MVTVNWINDGVTTIFNATEDFEIWLQWHYIKYKPYKLWNLKDKQVYAGTHRYIGYKYLGQLVIHEDEQTCMNNLKELNERRNYEKSVAKD